MSRQRKSEFNANRSARLVSAIAAAVLTWVQFHAVVSLAEEPPMAMAGHRGEVQVASAPTLTRFALAQPNDRPAVR